MPSSILAALLLLAAPAALLSPSVGATVASAHDHMGMHSIFPPILRNYWENGLSYWSFGSETVVTDDIVRLTQARPKSKGYLWNRHGNHLQSWQMNVTLQLDRVSVDDASEAQMAGVAVWFQTDTPRRGDRTFFGAPNRFNGLAVTMDHRSVISVFLNDGYSEVTDVAKDRRGFCRATTRAVTITVSYIHSEKSLAVSYRPEDKFYDAASLVDRAERDQQANDAARRAHLHSLGAVCASLSNVSLVTHSYFGLTAANAPSSFARVEVQKMFVAPTAGAEDLHDAEEEKLGLRMFDHVLDREERRRSTGANDDENQFNFPPEGGKYLMQRGRRGDAAVGEGLNVAGGPGGVGKVGLARVAVKGLGNVANGDASN